MEQMIEPVTQFGIAGLMGVLWMWERMHSRRRERELSEAHELLMRQRDTLDALLTLIRQNTRAIEQFEQTQIHLKQLLEDLHHDIRKQAA